MSTARKPILSIKTKLSSKKSDGYTVHCFKERSEFKTPDFSASKHYQQIVWDEKKLPLAYKKFIGDSLKDPGVKIFESTTSKHKEYAHFINNNQWYKLDLNDPDFILNVTKAFRLEEIDEDDLTTAGLLFAASEEFRYGQIKQYKCDEQGGLGSTWSPKVITYITPAILNNLKRKVAKIKESHKNYFTINFSARRQAIFFIHWLQQYKLNHQTVLLVESLLKKYIINRIPWQDTNFVDLLNNDLVEKNFIFPSKNPIAFQQFFIDAVDDIPNSRKNKAAIRKLQILLVRQNIFLGIDRSLLNAHTPDKRINNLENRTRDIESLGFFAAMISTLVEQGPFITLSPDYNQHDPQTPLICAIFPAAQLHKQWLLAFFGEQALLPQLYAGHVTTRLINQYELEYQTRPMEFIYPGLNQPTVAHECYAHNYTFMIHDYIFHSFRSGIIENKQLFRYLKKLLMRVKGFDMSKLIWEMSDLDYPLGKGSIEIRQAIAKNSKHENAHRSFYAIYTLENLIPTFWYGSFEPNLFIILIDMIQNFDAWEKILGLKPEKYIEQHAKTLRLFFNKKFNDKNFQNLFSNLKKYIVHAYPGKSTEFYYLITQFMRHAHLNTAWTNLCNTLHNEELIPKLFQWNKNKGLEFKPNLIDAKNTAVEDFNSEKLYFNTLLATNRYLLINQCRSREIKPSKETVFPSLRIAVQNTQMNTIELLKSRDRRIDHKKLSRDFKHR